MLRPLAILAGTLAILATGSLAAAQVPSLAEQQGRLREANAQSRAAQARSAQLERQAAAERDRAAQARAQEAAAAERIKAAEADIAAARARIAIVDRQLAEQRTRVAERQGPILRLIAALQSMARRPAVLGLVQPGSTGDMVHVRAVLGTVMPVVEARTRDVRAELGRVRALRAEALVAVTSFRDARQRIENERIALVRLEADHRARSAELGRSALVESDRAIALGERAREIVDQMETAGEAAEIQANLAALPGPLPRPGSAVAAPSRKAGAPYVLPVAGAVVTGMGELSSTGVRARGVTLACAAKADAVAPAPGRILFAGPFRDYGGVVIIDHGNGWTSSVTGLGGIAVRVGQQVAQGARIGRAPGGEAPRVTVELRRRGEPMDLARLLG
ncbi:peptidoglycan DD-metalloendopeptidase family protein [Sphingomonas sp. HITSZ_GF]|uniref:murein hydrolase activator EnvC family protein n=1 Tax=Sphingomonas sp. HITSZ_GF TaxID=3037247 RepID=UPI00240D3468|nr:peptidoglycan DD-metalloendopeptidase family protein [Sphingomonas sp. HITSZ_GF]MDG2533512.1 peptidoglycan DD-metalloendopeptidase family protein [Sphingomonas sp. HITSZ_GF]